jgi:ATP-dependent Lhr-like helicase
LLIKNRRLGFSEIVEVFKKAYPYEDLNENDVERVLKYMHGRFPRLAWVSFEDKMVLRPRQSKALFEYYFDNLSMIPEEKQFLVIDESSDQAVGVLDEAFMAEFGKPGTKFIIRGSPWIIQTVSEEKVHVRPIEDPTGAIPSWIGEEIPVPFMVSQEVGLIRGFVEEQFRKGTSTEKIAEKLSEKYPSDKDAILRALSETIEHVNAGFPAPTDKRMIVEDWKEFVLIHCNFGSLANRALALLLGELVSDKMGFTAVVQHDPYRIFVQTMGNVNAGQIVTLFDDVKTMSEQTVRGSLTNATLKTGLFKRRMIHVAHRFGALQKWADFSSVSLQKLVKSFEGTPVYEEALKEVFTKDLDVEMLLQILGRIRDGDFKVVKVETGGASTPIARLGIERISMKTDLIPPERMRAVLVESAKARLLNETSSFVCTNCWSYSEQLKINDLPDKPKCPRCGSSAIGFLKIDEETLLPLVEKQAQKLTKAEEKLHGQAMQTAKLMEKYGKAAAIALSARKVQSSDVRAVLEKQPKVDDRFYELVLEAERKALSKRFW